MRFGLAISYFDIPFWIMVAGMAVALRLTGRKATTFGVLNLGALFLVADLRTAIAAAAFALAAWYVLWSVLRVRALAEQAQRQAKMIMAGSASLSGDRGAVATLPEPDAGTDRHLDQRARLLAKLATFLTGAALLFPIALFVFYKASLEFNTVAEGLRSHSELTALDLMAKGLRALAFSYVALRYVEAAHAVLWKKATLIDPLGLAGYLIPFHMLLCGPVNRYDEHLRWESSKIGDANAGLLGLNDITTGLFYKFVVAEYLTVFFFGDTLVSTSWWDTALIFVYLFFDFAGYSRIALGIGRWLGVPTPVNFRTPFLATSVTEFFTRWHMSLGSFVLRNIYTPIQLTLTRRWGVKQAWCAGMIALLTSWLFVGLWHRLSLAFLAYGILMGVLVWTEKWLRDRALKQPWARSRWATWASQILGPIYVFVTLTTAIHLVIREVL